MRHLTEEQTYLNFAPPPSLKIHRDYQQTYLRISDILDDNPQILGYVADDFERISSSAKGRRGTFTVEMCFRAVLVHQLEACSLRDTVIRIAESASLRDFVRLGLKEVMDFTFLGRCVKAIEPETWKLINETIAGYAIKSGQLQPKKIRVDSTVIETNIHYPTDTSLLWDGWRVLTRIIGQIRQEHPELVPQRFHSKKVKQDYLFAVRYWSSKSKARQRKVRQRMVRFHGQVQRAAQVAEEVIGAIKKGDCSPELHVLSLELKHYLPLVKKVCRIAKRAALQGETVPAKERIFSIFEEHTELIKRGKSGKPVEFGHSVWLSQSAEKFITDYEVMEEKIPDNDLLDDIIYRHKKLYHDYPESLGADGGFRPSKEILSSLRKHVAKLTLPARGREQDRPSAEDHHFRAGIEGTISVLKRAFRMMRCYYRGFKSFASAVGMAICAHNLRHLAAPG